MNVVFLGTGDIAEPSLRSLLNEPDLTLRAVITQPDRPAGRGLTLRANGIKHLALAHGVEVFQPAKIREADAVAQIASWKPDLLVVMAYGQILPPSLLELAPLGALNLHASLLPRHRGASPVQAALLAGDHNTGITTMWMDAGLDTGDILLQQEILIRPDETGGSLHDRLAALAPQVLTASLRLIRSGSPPRLRQDNALATYAPKLDRAAGRMDWTRTAEESTRRIRAFHPWPGCSANLMLENDRPLAVKILRATAEPGSAPAGTIIPDLTVGCAGGGLLHILEIQAAGGRPMSAADFRRGHHPSHFLTHPTNPK